MRVLIAEDDTTSRLILQEILTQLGHDVVTAANGQEAWSIFNREHVPLRHLRLDDAGSRRHRALPPDPAPRTGRGTPTSSS